MEDVFFPPLGLLETMVFVLPERARGQESHLAAVFVAAKVIRRVRSQLCWVVCRVFMFLCNFST